jgi:exopolyphosphatase/guanosine-5'-triphosphate,3'-diphosphate pyrophosphatase
VLLLASIDVGSNTLRLLIGRVEGKRIVDVFSDRRITRLANRINETGSLQCKNMEASISVLKEFSSAISRHGVRRVKAVATSALREASNSDIFIKRVFEATGISIEVITGEKEAGLTLKGVLWSLPLSESDSAFIIDMGGGSTEWVLYKGMEDPKIGSIPVGVIKLTQNFLKSSIISQTDMTGLCDEITPIVQELAKRIGHLAWENTLFIGTAGTFTTIASIDLGLDSYSREKIHRHKVPLARLKNMFERLRGLPLDERKKLKGLEPERADLIIPGILFTIKVMEIFEFPELVISDYGLLEGALLELKERDGKNFSASGKS